VGFFANFTVIFLQKFADKVRRGARGITDVMASVKQMLTEKKGLDVIMNYINVSPPPPLLLGKL
jgi:hypothetical protein